MQTALYYLFCALAVGGALGVVVCKNYINAAMAMLLSMLGMSGMMFLMGAFFPALIMLIVYAGAVMVLFLFIVMLIGEKREEGGICKSLGVIALWALMCGVFAIFAVELPKAQTIAQSAGDVLQNSKQYGAWMFGKFLPMFEIAGVILLVAMVGIVAIAKDKSPKRPKREMLG